MADPLPPELDRYSRQVRFPHLGEEGQRSLLASRVLICGCGALGSVLANTLARAGIGHIRLVDRDFLETSNLQRQVLYDEDDVTAGLPKAIAAQRRLARINSTIEIEAHVTDVDAANISGFLEGVDMILDGTDNFETRFLLNDAAVSRGLPWVYGGCIGAEGQCMTILPGETPCLRCLHAEAPPPGTMATCDTAGILGPIINVIASIEACEALKILSGNRAEVSRNLTVIDLWDSTFRSLKLDGLKAAGNCPCCDRHEFPWLSGERGSHTAVLCGRNAVQLTFPERQELSLEQLEQKLRGVGQVTRNRFLLRLTVDRYTLTVFPDGRAIVAGTEEITEARTVYAKYVGN